MPISSREAATEILLCQVSLCQSCWAISMTHFSIARTLSEIPDRCALGSTPASSASTASTVTSNVA